MPTIEIIADEPDFIPSYETSGAACCDLRAYLPGGELILPPMKTLKIDCGFSMAIPQGYEAQIRSRSGLAYKNIIVTNGIGTIDEDFRGRICVLLTNLNSEPFSIKHKDRIAQMAFKEVLRFEFTPVEKLSETERGTGGFGSTGVK